MMTIQLTWLTCYKYDTLSLYSSSICSANIHIVSFASIAFNIFSFFTRLLRLLFVFAHLDCAVFFPATNSWCSTGIVKVKLNSKKKKEATCYMACKFLCFIFFLFLSHSSSSCSFQLTHANSNGNREETIFASFLFSLPFFPPSRRFIQLFWCFFSRSYFATSKWMMQMICNKRYT